MSSYRPDQIDDANLAYYYEAVNDARGVYYQLKREAPQGFPASFWASQRSQVSQVAPTASSSQTSNTSYFHRLTAASNKNRLYIAVYPSGVVNNEERRYHWAFLIGPKVESGVNVPGVRYHVKNRPVTGWMYESVNLNDVRSTNTLLARFVIAKVENEQRLIQLLQNLPVVNGDPTWRCRTWIAQALAEIAKDGQCVGSSQLDWKTIEAFARQYIANKTAAGRYANAQDLLLPKPTYDLLEGKETVP